MKKTESVLVKVNSMIVKGSTRGCGRRYVMWGTTPEGKSLKFETSPTSPSNTTCNIHTQRFEVLVVELRTKGVLMPVAELWDSSQTRGIDLESAFETEKQQHQKQGEN